MKPTTYTLPNRPVRPTIARAQRLCLLFLTGLLTLAGCKKDTDVNPGGPVTPTPPPIVEPLLISASVTTKTNLVDRVADPDLPDYIVTTSIDVNHELTINPGVVIAFERDVRMNVNDGGGLLIAKGTPDKKIKFVGVQKTKGYWTGISLYSGSNANTLENAEVNNAGSIPIVSAKKANIAIWGTKATMSIKIRASAAVAGTGFSWATGHLLIPTW